MTLPITLIIIFSFIASAAGGFFILNADKEIIVQNGEPFSTLTSEVNATTSEVEENGSLIDLIFQATDKSEKIKGIYAGPARNASSFISLLDETELNGLVIDVKEAYGTNLPAYLKTLIPEFHKQDVWMIARLVVFRDSSLLKEKPEWYLATSSMPWQDKAGQYWLDPDSEEVRDYIIDFSKKVIDYGFDEIQFDYIRYPDDYDGISGAEKIRIISDFFSNISSSLREYKSSIILSVDFFGYVATQFNSYEIGQRLIDAAKYFDYISFMLYPSHFYGGFSAPDDSRRQIPAVYFPYKDDNTTTTSHLVSSNPYGVVLRSVFSSLDYLDSYGIKAKIRPWLQDFDLKVDTARGIFYDAEKVRSEITAAQDAGSLGWLLWNPSYIYTKSALKNK